MKNEEIIKKLTIEQKANAVMGTNSWNTFENKELGIRELMFSDGPNGLRTEKRMADGKYNGERYPSVSFPALSLAACSFDREILKLYGNTLGEEANHYGVNVLLGPAINIKRNPLGGRNFEYLSEDPFLVGELATAYVNGVQSHKVAACLKHFAVNSQETDRMAINAVVDERALREIYLKGFEKTVLCAKPQTIMASYNMINGLYACANKHILTEILRNEWGFDGLVMSDWFAVENITDCIKAGMDLEMPNSGPTNLNFSIKKMNTYSDSIQYYDRAVNNLINLGNKVQFIEPDYKLDLERDHKIAKKIADSSIVLLKNKDNILPLNENEKYLFIGEFADTPRFQGGGSSNISSEAVTKIKSLINKNIEVLQGYSTKDDKLNAQLLSEVEEKVSNYNTVICFLGINEIKESEGRDRDNCELHQCEIDLINKLHSLNKKIIVVLEVGSSTELPFIDEIDGLILPYLGGEAINETIYDVLMGKVNPSGKLAETFIKSYDKTPSLNNFPGNMVDVMYKESIFVGYRYFLNHRNDVLYPFGYGLSYSKFEYKKPQIIKTDSGVRVTVSVTNISEIDGSEIVQVYVKKPAKPELFMPEKELVGFEKVFIKAGETKEISIEINEKELSYFDIGMNKWNMLNGEYVFYISKDSFDDSMKLTVTYDDKSEEYYKYENINSYKNVNLQDISDVEFSHLFVEYKMKRSYRRTDKFDFNSTISDGLNHDSKGARKLINLMSKSKAVKNDPGALFRIKETPIRIFVMASHGNLQMTDMQCAVDLLNDDHILTNMIRFLKALSKIK